MLKMITKLNEKMVEFTHEKGISDRTGMRDSMRGYRVVESEIIRMERNNK